MKNEIEKIRQEIREHLYFNNKEMACPTELRVYDISEITTLPYPIIHNETSFDDSCEVEQWQNNHHLIFCRNKTVGSNA